MVSATAQLGFIQDLDLYAKEKPYWLFIGKPRDKLDVEPTNVKLDTVRDIPLHDVRGKESQYNLEQHGFKFIKNHHTFKQFHDQDQIVADYLPQVEELIKRHVPYAEKIHIYDWRVKSPPSMMALLTFANRSGRSWLATTPSFLQTKSRTGRPY